MNKTVLGVLIGVLGALTVTCIGGAVFASWWLSNNTGPPRNVTITSAIPAGIRAGSEFEITITVADTSGNARVVKDIDFHGTLLDGVTVVSVTPMHAGYDPANGFHTYTMDAPVPANATTTIVFRLLADTPGTYAGDLDVSVDGIMRIHTMPTVYTIDPPK